MPSFLFLIKFLFHLRQPLFVAGEFAGNYLGVCFPEVFGHMTFYY